MGKERCFGLSRRFRGGSRGRVQGLHTPPPPRDDPWFSNTTGILQKKKSGLLVLKQSKRRVHPLLKKILDPPLRLWGGIKTSSPKNVCVGGYMEVGHVQILKPFRKTHFCCPPPPPLKNPFWYASMNQIYACAPISLHKSS